MTDEGYTLPPAAAPRNHGHTTAAWALVAGVVLGTLVLGIGIALGHTTLAVIGGAIVAASLLLSLAMRSKGLGQPLGEKKPRDWYAD